MSLTTIRSAIATRILTVAGFSSANVRQDKFSGDAVSTFPFACIYHTDTERFPITMGSKVRYQHNSDITVDLHTNKAAAANLQDRMDTLSALIVAAIESTKDLSGAAFDCYCSGWVDEFSSEGATPLGVRSLQFRIEWQTETTY
jgi:hypothetical protein